MKILPCRNFVADGKYVAGTLENLMKTSDLLPLGMIREITRNYLDRVVLEMVQFRLIMEKPFCSF